MLPRLRTLRLSKKDRYNLRMEATGLAVGVVALAGLFNNTVDTFNYVQVSRDLGTKYQTGLLKLENTQLRLSRWGQSLGLGRELQNVTTLENTFALQEKTAQAEARLGHILRLFEEAQSITTKMVAPEVVVYDPASEGNATMATLSEKMRAISVSRQNKTPLRQKAKWALYQEKTFRRIIEDSNELVKELEDLFPAAEAARQLTHEEVASIAQIPGSIPILAEIASSDEVQDEKLREAIEQHQKDQGGSVTYTTTFGNVTRSMAMAHNSGSINGTFNFGKDD